MLPPPAATAPTSGGVAILTVAGFAPHLDGGLVQEAVAVQAAGGELAAVVFSGSTPSRAMRARRR